MISRLAELSRLAASVATLTTTAVLAACAQAPSAGPTTTTTTTTKASTTQMPADKAQSPGCIKRDHYGAPRQIEDPQGPYYHTVWLSQLSGLEVTNAEAIIQHASVPDGVRTSDNKTLIYYVSGETGGMHVGSWDGTTFADISAVTFDGHTPYVGPVDPDAILLDDGTIRLAFLDVDLGPNPDNEHRVICIADSADGKSFKTVGTVLEGTQGQPITDPSITRVGNKWFLAISEGQASRIYTSDDGRTFREVATTSAGGVPEIKALPDGTLRLFVCGAGIVALDSADGGLTWSDSAVILSPSPNEIRCDPSVVESVEQERSTFLYKTAPGPQGPAER